MNRHPETFYFNEFLFTKPRKDCRIFLREILPVLEIQDERYRECELLADVMIKSMWTIKRAQETFELMLNNYSHDDMEHDLVVTGVDRRRNEALLFKFYYYGEKKTPEQEKEIREAGKKLINEEVYFNKLVHMAKKIRPQLHAMLTHTPDFLTVYFIEENQYPK